MAKMIIIIYLAPGAKVVRAMYDYAARTQEDLTFKKGDIMEIIDDK